MSNNEAENYDENEDQLDEELQEGGPEDNKKIGAAPIWIISILLHSIVLAALMYWIIDQAKKKEDMIITTQVMPEEEEPLDEKKEIAVVKEKADVTVETDSVLPPQVTNEEVADHNETENEMDNQTAEGTEEGISDSPQVGSGLMGNIGGGGGGGGSFGQRNGGGRKRAVMRGGGSKATESAVDWALWWLANHQEKDGHWDSGKYEGAGTPEVDSAATGSALLAFLGAGHTDRAGKWKTNVKTAVAWLVSAQKPNGSWDTRNYANGICTMAMAEAAGMGCGGSEVKKSAEMAVDYLLKQQNVSGGFDYTGPDSRNDMSVTGWCIMGLKSAILAGIKEAEIKAAFHKCGDLLDKVEGTKDNTSTSKGIAWYDTNNETLSSVGTGAPGGACQAIAMLVRQYLGWERSAPWLEAAADGQVAKIPAAYAGSDVYRIYYSFLTLFQQGGKHWTAWNEPVSKMVVAAQRQDGDFRGSWDKNGCHLDKGGRVMYTAFLCLSLEIYYRYKSVMK